MSAKYNILLAQIYSSKMITKTFGGTYLTLSEHPDSNCRVVKILESGTGEKHLNPDLPLSGLAN